MVSKNMIAYCVRATGMTCTSKTQLYELPSQSALRLFVTDLLQARYTSLPGTSEMLLR